MTKTEIPPAPTAAVRPNPNTESGWEIVIDDGSEKAPCGCDLLHQGAWLRHLICTRGHRIDT